MNLAEIAAELRTVADRMRRAHSAEMRDQGAVEYLSERAGEIARLANRLTESEDARRAEVRAGLPRKSGGGVHIACDGRVITRDTLFRRAA